MLGNRIAADPKPGDYVIDLCVSTEEGKESSYGR